MAEENLQDCVTRQQDGVSTSAQACTDAANAPHRIKIRRRRQRSKLALEEWTNIPSYLKDNEYIKKYYRVDYTFSQTLRSLFTIHNETLNVWTHLIGAVLFVVLTIITIAARPAPIRLAGEHLSSLENRLAGSTFDIWRFGRHVENYVRDASGQVETQLWSAREQIEGMLAAKGRGGFAALQETEERLRGYGDARLQDLLSWYHWLIQNKSTRNMKSMESAIYQGLVSIVDLQWPAKRWPIHVFTFGAMFCLTTSTICHLFGSLGYKKIAHKIWKYDYAGIVVLIVTSFVPVVYYSFLCSPRMQTFYLLTTCFLGLITIAVSLMKTFQHYKYRTFRACLFAGLGLWGVVPGAHALLKYGSAPWMQKAFTLDLLMGLTYLVGATLYAARVPERWYPGAFDLYFNSHQIFHVAVVIAALLHYWGMRILLQWRDNTGGCTIPFQDLMASHKMLNSSVQ